ncbi:Synaptotagmin-4 [Acorus gramineus]|uniref:Synaptotagmin-4 n=1 Tax=Acorus gramineus TaxID=55184 RepID=A0AAV9BJQ3_ACOGR|nr:Synaptotagmin-4 [Acorus gramineus]
MGLISGLVMGILTGIALMAGWMHMMRRRSTKRVAKAVDIKLLGSLNRDDLKKICGDSYPEWISFPVYEQVKWMNKQLSKLWPFVADAATMVIKETVEPMLEDYRPTGISSLKFSKLSLGTVPPKIEGIRVQSLKKGQITMDIDFRWGGDPSIILAVEALVASLPIQLKDLQVFTIVRVIFQLTEEIPCISAVVVALLSEPQPRIDYTLKAVGGSLTAIPGLSDMIDDTVKTIVTDMLQWPHRIVVPIGGVPVDTSDLELKPQGRLTVTIVKATGLKNMEMIGKSDPYAVVYIRPTFKVKTKVIDNNLNPVWNEKFVLIAEDKETQSLILEVFDKDIGQDKSLGIVKLPLIDLEPETTKEIELRLMPSLDMLKIKDKKDRGNVTIQVTYHHFNKEEQMVALEEEKRIMEERRKLKEAGMIGSTMDALGSGVGAGAGLVAGGIGAGASLVGSGFGAVGSGLSKAGKFMGKSVTGNFGGSSKRNGSTPTTPTPENGKAS